jgi:hypothetical protein
MVDGVDTAGLSGKRLSVLRGDRRHLAVADDVVECLDGRVTRSEVAAAV